MTPTSPARITSTAKTIPAADIPADMAERAVIEWYKREEPDCLQFGSFTFRSTIAF